MMRCPVTLLLGALAMLAATAADAQYRGRENIELQCYGGRNQMRFHVCACDQSGVSGAAAMTLGNVMRLWGPGSQADCIAWANQMNGVGQGGAKIVDQAKQSPRRPPASVPPPEVAKRPPPTALKVPSDVKLSSIFRNWNNDDGAGCASKIHTSEMRLSKEAYVDKVILRINWRGQGDTVEGRWAYLHSDGHTRQLTFERGNCSRSSGGPDWCGGSADIKAIMPAGQYSVNVFKPILCRNAKSRKTGFAQIWGTYETAWAKARETGLEQPGLAAGPSHSTAESGGSAASGEEGDGRSMAAARAGASGGAPAGKPTTLFNNWNTGGCGLTDNAAFNLDRHAYVSRLETWTHWPAVDGDAFGATLLHLESGEKTRFTYRRLGGRCHPNMPDWCYGAADLSRDLPAGGYEIQAEARAMCVNRASGGTGYVRVIGTERGVASGHAADDQTASGDGAPSLRKRRTRDLPKLSYKRPKLGMPGNRRGSAGGEFVHRFGR